MPDRNNFFYVDGKGEEVKEVFREEPQIAKPSEIKSDILDAVKKGLGFLKDWHLCPYCNVVFGLSESKEGECPNCGYRYFNERGALVVRGRPIKEEEESEEEKEIEEEEKEQEEEEQEEEFESVIISQQGGMFEVDVNEEFNVKKIGVKDCPFCEKSIDWNRVDIHYGLLRIVKECPECNEEIYKLSGDENVRWLRRNPEQEDEEEIGLLGGAMVFDDEGEEQD